MSVQFVEDLDVSQIEDIEVACDISALRAQGIQGLPPCQGDPARWIAWRTTGCCGKAPKYRLICDRCKATYLNWQARGAAIFCAVCAEETGGFVQYVPLRRTV